ncbi:Fe-S cluster assembly protein SufD [Propionibacteriaceae bacterium ES.041]|uniref:Fe-S cluster assembly protein SufD n=1 Tax=Enemella evansiae TaxID=2016499 RepID=A0A255GG95_9ACTN|nr:Fe-S cluster assembly protein SufD [Enemella evansiae]PFG67807.1 Fe-S cluster assembly protein SufD [Propionibacteriaceae bacterium ES.041]OYN92983.1 Fe-S cluster assembly protein SufD [Enemella evansiae]OYN94725.1 Fe-S cluster assembly protein SufD [Enemella evansiae]OYO04183.1 Fe-S cluster assembly protein SufD [Enemella evansiae]OYO08470.1 Fe-S cluster assembly protein SufD [Enemella evansiae]
MDTKPNVAGAVESSIASHLHPRPSYDLADHPVPQGREEVWRFTPLKRLRGLLEAEGTGAKLGRQVRSPEGVTVTDLPSSEARKLGGHAPGDRLAAVAAAYAGEALLVDVPANTELDEPVVVELTGDSVESVVHGHLVFRIGNHSRATIAVRHNGSATYAGLTQVLVGDGADVTFVAVADWADDAVHTGQTSITVGRDAQVRSVAVSLGGDLVRIAETAEYAGPGGSIDQYGLYFVDAGQHIEHRLFVDHNAPKTRSNVDYRGALQGKRAHSVWIGDVLIRKVAEGIETYESNKNLLLTDGCKADSVPNLEIETGEIEGAGHASTTGRFDDQQLFYLRSRGIDETEARRLVVHGFFADIIRRIGVPEVEQHLLAAIETELALTVGTPALTETPESNENTESNEEA